MCVVVVWVVVELVVVLEVEVGVDVHDSLTCETAPLTGSGIEEIGVPGATLTVNDIFCPVISVTVITHVSAEALGIAASAITTSIEHAVKAATTRFRLLSTVAFLLPPGVCAQSRRRDHAAACDGRY